MSTSTLTPSTRDLGTPSAQSPQSSQSTRSPRTSTSYRLTRRGRLVVLLLGLALAFAAGVVFAAGSMASSDEPAGASSESVLVQPGDSLWSIASEVAGDGDVRDTMTRIEQLNDLDSSMVDAGQRLLVPTD